jgi:hypothetical protein
VPVDEDAIGGAGGGFEIDEARTPAPVVVLLDERDRERVARVNAEEGVEARPAGLHPDFVGDRGCP